MSIDRIMQRPVVTLPPEATCAEAATLMRDENIGAVVIAESGRPLGMVTDRESASSPTAWRPERPSSGT
jgi:CBS domain-containing protein